MFFIILTMLAFVAGGTLIIGSICWIAHNCEVRKLLKEEPKEYIKLTFKQFKSFYAVAPTKWTVSSSHAYPRYGKKWDKTIKVLFSFPDFVRYNNWLAKKENTASEEQNQETVMEYMDYWREDAKDYEKKALCEILEARKRILQIQEELKKNGYTVDDGGVSDSE